MHTQKAISPDIAKMPPDFLAEEVRSGFPVTRERKKLWAVQLDLLAHFDQACKDLNLTYFATGGTLLGAVRHHGFIPWDDDLDLHMLWADYEILLKEAPLYFKPPYFFQSYLSEKEYEPTNSRLRRSDTTGCTKYELECISDSAYNRGIFIDIIPLFAIPDDETALADQIDEIMKWWRLYKGYEIHREKKRTGESKLNKEFAPFEQLYLALDPPMSFAEVKANYIAACAQVTGRTKRLADLSFRATHSKARWQREWFDGVVRLPFEWLSISCPKGYEARLEHEFGDWRQPIKGGAYHEEGIIDADMPFTEKLKSYWMSRLGRQGTGSSEGI